MSKDPAQLVHIAAIKQTPTTGPRLSTHTWCLSYLSTELEVDHNDADLGTGDDQDDEHQEEEAKEVVELILPNCLDRERERHTKRRGHMKKKKPTMF